MASAPPAPRRFGRFLAGWRGLGRFWFGVLVVLGVGAGVVDALGPSSPPRPPITVTGPVVHTEPAPVRPAVSAVTPPPHPSAGSIRPGRETAGPVASPDPALQEPYPGPGNLTLPRISDDGRAPMAVYAAGFDPSNLRPRVGILIAGLGMSEADSAAAIQNMPEGVSLAVSPYARDIGHLLDAVRLSEHEYLLSIPMEPQGFPVNDPDDRHALMASLPPADNMDRLHWVLSRLTGYVGVTSALGQMHGERLESAPNQLDPVLEDVARRGLLFVDARPGQPPLPHVWSRSVDVLIDADPLNAAMLDQRLDALAKLAQEKGSALGLVSVPRPVTLSRVIAWTNTLAEKGLALAPVSALMQPPAQQDAGK